MMSLYPSVVEAFPKVTRPLEGCVLWPYLDVFGLATVGYGCLVDSVPEFRKPPWAVSPPRIETPDARDSFVDDQRARLKAKNKALHFKRYADATQVRLTQDAADTLLVTRAEDFAAYMRAHHFKGWDTWPADAQLAWMLIAWACGPGCPVTFKTAAALAQKRDWQTMRHWARINPGTSGQSNWNPGVVPRNAQIDICLANAAAIDNEGGYSTPALYWPGPVLPAQAPLHEAAAEALASYDVEACGLTGSCHTPMAA